MVIYKCSWQTFCSSTHKKNSSNQRSGVYLGFQIILKCNSLMECVIHLGRRGRDRMVFGFTTTHATSDYHQQSYQFEPCSWRGVLETTLGDKVCQWLPTSRRFSPGAPVSSANNTDRHDIAEILLKVALNTITLTLYIGKSYLYVYLI